MCKFSKQRKTLQQFVSTLKSLPTLIKSQLLKMQIFIVTSQYLFYIFIILKSYGVLYLVKQPKISLSVCR